jgi:hypothetical protein
MLLEFCARQIGANRILRILTKNQNENLRNIENKMCRYPSKISNEYFMPHSDKQRNGYDHGETAQDEFFYGNLEMIEFSKTKEDSVRE